MPKPATAEPAPNAAIPRATAPIPLPASISAAPSNSSKLFNPSAIVGSDFPTIHVAPAIAPPISTIAAASPAAPSATVGFANALMPPARPFSTPPSPLPMPLPIFPIALPAPLPALALPLGELPVLLSLPPPNMPLILAPRLLVSAPAAALLANNTPIPATNAPTTPALSHSPDKPSVRTPVIALNHSPLATLAENSVRLVAIPVSSGAIADKPAPIASNTPLATKALCNAALTSL